MATTEAIEEVWRPVPIGGRSHRYDCSNLGRIRSRITGKILKPAPTSRGYLTVNLSDGNVPKKQRSFTVHSIICKAFNGEPFAGQQVDHIDCDKTNNNAANLEWVTGKENMRRARKNGLVPVHSGERHANAKLTDSQVLKIRAEPEVWGVNARLAREHGVSEAAIRQARKGTTYRDVKGT